MSDIKMIALEITSREDLIEQLKAKDLPQDIMDGLVKAFDEKVDENKMSLKPTLSKDDAEYVLGLLKENGLSEEALEAVAAKFKEAESSDDEECDCSSCRKEAESEDGVSEVPEHLMAIGSVLMEHKLPKLLGTLRKMGGLDFNTKEVIALMKGEKAPVDPTKLNQVVLELAKTLELPDDEEARKEAIIRLQDSLKECADQGLVRF